MRKNKILLSTLLICSLCLFGCGKEEEEEVVYGDINEDIDYTSEEVQLPSAVEREDKININDYYAKVPISITEDIVSSTLPNFYGTYYNVDRIQLNNVYFDINAIANSTSYDYYIDNGIFKMVIPYSEDSTIDVSVAQIFSGDSYKTTDAQMEELNDIILEYQDIYDNTENQVSGEYGYYYTYDKYVDYLNSNEELKYDISVYDTEQVLQLVLETFGMEDSYTVDDFLANDNCSMVEYSTWYDVMDNYYCGENDNYAISISVKRNASGVFAFMTRYPRGSTMDNYGEDYFTPTMIINFAQNNYQQLAETYAKYVERTSY